MIRILVKKKGILAIISNDGSVYINPPVLITSSCQIQISEFPFDEQNCELVFGRWFILFFFTFYFQSNQYSKKVGCIQVIRLTSQQKMIKLI